MSTHAPPRVEPACARRAEAARALVLTPAQALHAGDIAFQVDNAMQAPGSDAMVVLSGPTVIGFYRLDYPNATPAQADADRRTVTLRAFALDRAWQGRGFGAAALQACFADLARRRPDRQLLMLSVHESNPVAARLYRRAGFVDSGRRLPGGPAGPQRLLLRALGVGESTA